MVNPLTKKQIIISSLGNTIEWFDFGLFIFMAPIIGAKFFPQGSASTTTLEALIVFAAGFICRPLGGIFFGYFGDTHGRKGTLRISVLIITISTLLIGIMPAYQDIGYLSTILFILLRLVQGLSIGGEYSGVMIYLAESAPNNKRGFITSFAATGANLGFLLATLILMLLNIVFSKNAINDWAWRLPFILVGLPGSLIIYYRFKLSETIVYRNLQENHQIKSIPFFSAIKFAPYQLLKIFGLTCMGTTFYYFFVGYMPIYLKHYEMLSSLNILFIQSCLLIAMLFMVPLGAMCGDYFTRKKMLIITSILIILFIFPCFYILQTKSILLILLALFMIAILSSLEQGNTLTAVVENCPENVRYSGIAFSYNLGNALFGGTAPLVFSLLSDNVSFIAPAYYLWLMAGVSLFTATKLIGNNQTLGPI